MYNIEQRKIEKLKVIKIKKGSLEKHYIEYNYYYDITKEIIDFLKLPVKSAYIYLDTNYYFANKNKIEYSSEWIQDNLNKKTKDIEEKKDKSTIEYKKLLLQFENNEIFILYNGIIKRVPEDWIIQDFELAPDLSALKK